MSGVVLPEGWALSKIADISIRGAQRTPEANEHFTYVDIGSIDREIKAIFEPQYLLGETAPSRARKVINTGDILVSLTRPNLNAVALVSDKYDNQIASTGFEVIKPTLVDSRYIFALVRSKDFIDAISGKVQGALYPAAKSSDVQEYKFPLPPLAEQKVIADKLDSLLAQVDNIKNRLDALPNIIKRFKQSVLSAAVSGRLTEDWRGGVETQKINRQNILDARQVMWEKAEFERVSTRNLEYKNDKWKLKYKLPDDVLIEECFDIPNNWCWTNLGQLTWSVKDGPHYSPKYTDSGVPFISGGNISPDGISFANCKYISEELHKELSTRCKPDVGDLLYTKGGTTGIAYFNEDRRDFNVWVHVAVLKITNVIHGKYLQYALNSKHCYTQSQRYTHGVGNQDLGLTRMVKITIPLPPLEEQTEIVRRVQQLFAYADQIEQQVKNAQSRVNNLTQSILAKAFRGELTADWRAANPHLISGENSAQALLAKIKAERDKPKKTSKQQTMFNE